MDQGLLYINPLAQRSSVLFFPHHVLQRYALTTPSLARPCSFPAAIREYDAKLLLAYWLERAPPVAPHAQVKTKFQYPAVKVAQISWDAETDSITPDTKLPGWVFNTKLVAKPDQLIKRRGKAGLLALNKTWDEAKPWIAQRAGKPQKVSLVLSIFFCLPRTPPRWIDPHNVALSIHREAYRARLPRSCIACPAARDCSEAVFFADDTYASLNLRT